MSPSSVQPARLTIVEKVYYQMPGQQPAEVDSRFGRWVYNEAQPVCRYFQVGTEWEPLKTEWLTQAGMLVLANHEGANLTVIPTEEERKATLARVVEMGYVDPRLGDVPRSRDMFQESSSIELEVVPLFAVRPGESMRGEPFNMARIRLRCRSESARCALYLFP